MSKGWFNIESATNMVPENQMFEEETAFSSFGLSRVQRLYGFVGCLCIGFILSLLGAILLLLHQLTTFALLFTLGTVIALVGTGFVIGFFRQLKLMFKPVRIIATIAFFVSIGLVFVGAFVIGSGVLCIIFVIVQYVAFTWYTLSYIPYARSAILKMIGMG